MLDRGGRVWYTILENKEGWMHPPHLTPQAKRSTAIFVRASVMGAVPLRGCKGCIRVFYLSNGGATVISKVEHELNEEIRDKEIRLIGEDGEQLGIVSSAEGLHIAEEKGLDLVKISPQATPPVCKLMNYGKFKFERSKKEKEARKNQHVVEIKEIRMSPSIGENDFLVKLKNGQKFLTDGDRVKVTVRFRGREMAHTNIGEQLLRDFAAKCSELANLDKQPKLEGRNMSIFLSPKPQAPAKKPGKPKEPKPEAAEEAKE